MIQEHPFISQTLWKGYLTRKLVYEKLKYVVESRQIDSTIVGTKKAMTLYKDGGKQNLSLTNCRYVREL